VREARQHWTTTVAHEQPKRLIFLDETWFTTTMDRQFGYSPQGQRLVGAAPYGHWKVTTFVGGLTTRGFIAPMVLDGAMDGTMFASYVEQVLAAETRPGDLVILDNLSAHKTACVRSAFERNRIHYLYLPPYSPDLNPIENAFSKLKRLLRRAAERTVDGLWTAIGRLLDEFCPRECRNYFRHCRYIATKS
jgi:transposase